MESHIHRMGIYPYANIMFIWLHVALWEYIRMRIYSVARDAMGIYPHASPIRLHVAL